MKYLFYMLLTVIPFISPFTYASDSCIEVLSAFSTENFEPIGNRGLMPIDFKPTVPNKLHAFESGYFEWGTKVFLVESFEQAVLKNNELLAADPGGSRTGLIIITAAENIEKTEQIQNELSKKNTKESPAAKALFAKILQDAKIYNPSKAGELRELNSREKAIFVAETIKLSFAKPEDGPYFYHKGWHNPKMRGGIILSAETFAGSSTIKKLKKLGPKLDNKGYKLVIGDPQYMEAAVRGSMEQKRKGQEGSSRITEQDLENFLELQAQGKAYNAVLLNPDGIPVAGTYGMKSGLRIDGDSVFYKDLGDPDVKYAIDMAKIVLYAVMIRAHQAGFEIMDAQMVSSFTRSLRGIYIPRDTFHQMSGTSKDSAFEQDARDYDIGILDFPAELFLYDWADREKL